MSWRTVVISNRAKLDLQFGRLVVRGENMVKANLSEIHTVIIENTAVSLTACLIAELSKRKIKVVFCDEKRNPCSELVSYYGSHDTSLKLKMQLEWDDYTKNAVWTEIVTEKIRKQRDLLLSLGLTQAKMLDGYIEQIEFNDESNREGHSAKVYFNALFGMQFTRSEDTPLNAALNYGYAILLSAFNREVVSNGYITQLGLFHGNMFNQFNLSSDLMEPFRPLVDSLVLKKMPQKLEHEEKMYIVNLLNVEVVIDGKKHHLLNAIKIYCKSVFDALNEKDLSLIRFYGNEL